MANAGDSYTVELKEPHVGWGTYRKTASRVPRSGEAYIPIPVRDANRLNLYNQNHCGDRFGVNLFNCISADGSFSGVLRAQGCQSDGDHAKQFSADKDLKAIGQWYKNIGANVGDTIKITWTSDTAIVIEKIKTTS